MVQKMDPAANLFSSVRPGAVTATGFPSLHAIGKAIDVSPDKTLWNMLWRIRNSFRELYGPWGGWLMGKDRHSYPGWQTVLAGHKDHIHIGSYATGGFINSIPDLNASGLVNNAGTFDSGGTLAPGANLVLNKTGGNESLSRTDDLAPILAAILKVLGSKQHVKLVVGDKEFDAYIGDVAYKGVNSRITRTVYSGRKG
jgi:hypothetical protein